MYYDWQNQADDQSEGHGTHVCGIIAGNAADPSVSMYNVWYNDEFLLVNHVFMMMKNRDDKHDDKHDDDNEHDKSWW